MKIALVTDTHLSPRDTLLARNWAAVEAWIEAAGVDLMAHLGDITADGAGDGRELDHARALIAAGRDAVFLPGNHDIGDGPAEGGGGHERAMDPERLAHYRRVFGPDWWSLKVGAWQVVGLNAQLFGTGGEDEARQWAWLEETVRTGDGPLGVMSHKPLAPHGLPATETPTRYPLAEPRTRLMALLAERDLRFVMSGHTHQALSFTEGGVEHVWVPSCAFFIPDPMQKPVGDKRVAAMLLELGPEGHAFTPAEPPGLVRHDLFDLEHIYPEVAVRRARAGLPPRA